MNTIVSDIPKTMAMGISLALMTILFGFVLGLSFGAKESSIKAHLDDSGTSALQTAYHGDVAAKDKVVNKSWSYLKRAHLHGGAIGSSALVSIMALILFGRLEMVAKLSALAFGSGALIYSLFWLFAGLTAPGLGSTGAAKESLAFLAIPGAGLCVLGLSGIIFSVVKASYFESMTDS